MLGLLTRFEKSFFWLGLARDVEVFCQGCVICQRGKYKTDSRQPIHPMEIGQGFPGGVVSMDIGTLP